MQKNNLSIQELIDEIENELFHSSLPQVEQSYKETYTKEINQPSQDILEEKTIDSSFDSLNKMFDYSNYMLHQHKSPNEDNITNHQVDNFSDLSFNTRIYQAIEDSVRPLVRDYLLQNDQTSHGKKIDFLVREAIHQEVKKWFDKNLNSFLHIHVGAYIKEKMDKIFYKQDHPERQIDSTEVF